MELFGSNYLLTLATVSITFVGFSTVAVIFRQALGTGLSVFEIQLIRVFIVSGLMATIFSLIPALLGLLGITPSLAWRVSSLALALVLLFGEISYLRHRSQVQPGSLPVYIYILFGTSAATILGLLINAIGIVTEPNVGLYALGVTWMLVETMVAFIIALRIFLQPPKKG